MGLRILSSGDNACFFCSTSDVAFGPVFYNDRENGHDATERLELFQDFIKIDPRGQSDKWLEAKLSEFLHVEKELWAEKEND